MDLSHQSIKPYTVLIDHLERDLPRMDFAIRVIAAQNPRMVRGVYDRLRSQILKLPKGEIRLRYFHFLEVFDAVATTLGY